MTRSSPQPEQGKRMISVTSPRPPHLHGDHASARGVAALRAVLAALRGRVPAQRTQAVKIPRGPQLGPPRRPG